MDWILTIAGVALLLLVVHEIRQGTTDLFLLLAWDWLEFDLNRHEHPVLFWIAILLEAGVAVALILMGVLGFVH